MKIAVCDDDKPFAEKTAGMISALLDDRETCSITLCVSGEELIKKHETENFDIIFLDIMMGGMNGMEAAKKIRSSDTRTIIVFLTNYQEFAAQGYEVGAFRYLVKNQPTGFYEEQFRSALDEYYRNHKMFEIISKNVRSYIFLSEILFFEVLSKQITVHTVNGSYEYPGKLSDIEAQLLNDRFFVKSHKSCLVNVRAIGSINKNDVIMKNGARVPLSRGCKKMLVERYAEWAARG